MLKSILMLAFVACVLLHPSVAGESESTVASSSNVEPSSKVYEDDEVYYEYVDCEPGQLVPPPDPTCTKPNEVYEVCPAPCPFRTCGIDDRVIFCAPAPKPGDKNCSESTCRCAPGFFRDYRGNCVLWKDCDTTCTGINEVYDPCDSPCPARRCDFDASVVRCAAPPKVGDKACLVGCRCQDGFLRNDKGVCVAQDQCPKKCNDNEEYDPCPDCNPQTCSTVGQIFHCPLVPANTSDPRCKGACRCQKDYARDNNGDCVPIDYCSKCTGANEVYDPCPGCSPQTCETKDNVYFCPLLKCNATCRCKQGFFRNKIGQCQSSEDCAKCPGKHEYFSCGPACDNRCDSIYGQDNCNIQNIVCNKMCYCEKDYARASNGTCIPKTACQAPKCNENEVTSTCINGGCQKKLCTDLSKPVICLHPKDCIEGCLCQPGYLRNKKGICVPTEQCDVPLPVCKPNEEFSKCGLDGCQKRYCSDLDLPTLCRDTFTCNPTCECKQGYLRVSYDNDTCVAIKECPNFKKCGINEEYSDCSNGLCRVQDCADKGKSRPCPPMVPGSCVPGCVCPQGFLRSANGTCVQEDDCEQPPCPENEDLSSCPQTLCGPKTCEQAGFPIACPKFKKCPGPPGCVCAPGYLRNADGKCIQQNLCPSCGGDINARPGCGTNCGNRCSDRNNTEGVACIALCDLNGCDCKTGYLLDDNSGRCVKPNDCSKSCGVNEVFTNCANGLCRVQNCADKGKTKPCAPIAPGACKPGCVCPQGFLRSENGKCVREDKCEPPQQTCPANEELVHCPETVCLPETCKQAGLPLNCPGLGPNEECPGKPRCLCSGGYLRNSKGVCVPSNTCPSCGGDDNAIPGCGSNCGRLCSNYNSTEPQICPLYCNLNGCDCKPKYVFDSKTNKCVLPEKCSCGLNEEYSHCSNGLCRVQSCADKGKSRPCPPMAPGSCIPGCICPEGFLRSKAGKCVREDQCETQVQCPANEQLVQCPETICQPETCKQAGFPVPCPVLGPNGQCPGKPRCICNGGYLRNSKGVCVLKNQCSSCGGDENAIPGCGVNCGRHCSNYNSTGRKFCPLFCNTNGCDCKSKYVYDDNRSKCVLPEKCTPTCQVNEEFNECTNAICRPQKCADKDKSIACPRIPKGSCKTGCVCSNNFLRAANGTCIPDSQCDQTCPDDEYLNKCPPPKCDGDYCPRTRNDPQTCPFPNNDSSKCSKARCVCGILNLRDRNTGKCIRASQCPPFKCDGPNESFNNCVPTCPGETCEDYLNNATCPKFRIGIVVRCKLGCRCDKGYYRDSRNICVPASQCKKNVTPPPRCPRSDVTPTTQSATICDAQAQKQALEQGNAQFTGKFFYEVVKRNPGKSVFMSAYSVLTPLAELDLYADGTTYTQLASALNVKDKSDIRCGFPALLDSVTASNGTILDTPAKIYVYKQGKISKSLENDSEKIFRAKAENVDFTDAQGATDIINEWVSNATRGKITQLVEKDMFDDSTRLVLVNAIYFKGIWQYQFNVNNTKPRDFYVSSDKTIQVPTMTQKGHFKYAELSDPNVQALELPYQDPNITFLVILPKEKDGLTSVVQKLQDPQVFQNIIDSLSKEQVTIYLPKITELETKIDLKPVLQALGISDIFDSSKANINGMTDPSELLYVSDAIQKAVCTVNEKGAEAAASNAFIANTRSLPRPPPIEYTVNADHPFIFVIKRNNLILFTGTFAK